MRGSRRAWLAALLALLLLVLGEGVASLLFGRSLRNAWPEHAPERAPSATPLLVAPELGPYHLPLDPLVAYTLRPDAHLTFREGQVAMPLVTDELGMRRRSAPLPADALRVVVLGDSVAFGFGLDEGGTLAEQLEGLLAELEPTRPVACFTVAVPSWNVHNAFRFLLDHLDHYRPDIVLWLPVPNDLEDGYGVTEAGERRAGEDPQSSLPLLSVHPEWALLRARARELAAAGVEYERGVGVEVLTSGGTPLSRARFAAAARTLAGASARFERAGVHFALAAHEQSDFQRELRASLLRAGLALPEFALFESLEKADTLGIDPHPSARTVGVLARWVAEELCARGWLTCARAPDPAVLDEATRARRAVLPSAPEALAWSAAAQARLQTRLEARVSFETLQGALQIYGGMNLDGTLEPCFGAALRGGRELVVRLAPLAEVPGLYPLEVRVEAQGHELGRLRVEREGPSEAVFPLQDDGQALDVFLFASDHTRREGRGHSWLAAARLETLEVRP